MRINVQIIVPRDGAVAVVDAGILYASVVGDGALQHVVALDGTQRFRNFVVGHIEREDLDHSRYVASSDLHGLINN